jgi:hypothetical protein
MRCGYAPDYGGALAFVHIFSITYFPVDKRPDLIVLQLLVLIVVDRKAQLSSSAISSDGQFSA